MPVSFRILSERGLLYVRFEGMVTIAETAAAFAEYTRHPDMRPEQMHLLDMGPVTGWMPDFADMMKLHAGQLDVLLSSKHEILFVFCAPSQRAQALAQLSMRSWEDVPGVITLVSETEADALQVLGLPERTIDALLQNA